jgi:hypothetical protein
MSSKRNKRILVFAALLFFLLVIAATWDIMRRTSPPGSRKHLPNSILK